MMRNLERRQFIKASAAAVSAVCVGGISKANGGENRTEAERLPQIPVVDTHQHLWSVERMMPPWLAGADEILRQEYLSDQYRLATKGLDVSSIYMEVDMAPADHVAEADSILKLIDNKESATRAAVLGGRPADAGFKQYILRFEDVAAVKGVRQVLQTSAPRGFCLTEEFVDGMKALGRQNLVFDICIRPGELADAEKLIGSVPETRFVLDHCGNADPKAFLATGAGAWHDADQWKRDIEKIAGHKNVLCKISGIVARAPEGWSPKDLAPIVNHCLDSFGPQRVVFGSDWPVCRLRASLLDWVAALHEIISPRPEEEQAALWNGNASRFYQLS